jgi:hypothetical protein
VKPILIAVACFLALAGIACGSSKGPSGVDSSKYLDQLSASERAQFCTWAIVTEQGGSVTATVTKTCPDGSKTDIEAEKSCESDAKPHCQVSLLESCVTATGGDPCKTGSTPACMPYVQCAVTH